MSLETEIQEFTIHKDTDLLLVAIKTAIDNDGGRIDSVACLLVQPQHEAVLQRIAWDLLLMSIPYLSPLPNDPQCLTNLIHSIAKVGEPKEMCIAFLEALESTHSVDVIEMLLHPLATVISRAKNNQKLLYSTLYSTWTFIQRSLDTLTNKEKLITASTQQSMNNNNNSTEIEAATDTTLSVGSATPVTLARAGLQLLQTPLKYIHDEYSSNNGRGCGGSWSDLQRVCIGILTDLMGSVMTCTEGDREDVIGLIMEGVTYCHCGGLQLLEWKDVKRRRSALTEYDDDYNDDAVVLVPDKIAMLSCCLLKEDCLYLPSVLTHQYRLLLGLSHINCILDLYAISDSSLTLTSLNLLKTLLQRLSINALPVAILDNTVYKKSLLLICSTMTSSPVTSVRQEAVSILLPFINCFDGKGRHRLYDVLLREVHHTGIRGFLIQGLKDEVNKAMDSKVSSSSFLGEDLQGLYQQFLVVPDNADVLSEYDRYMSGLNFLRFLLLKDSSVNDKTSIWSIRDSVKSNYLTPLRSAITCSSVYCKSLINNPDEIKRQRQGHVADVNMEVEIIGGEQKEPPEMSFEEEIQLLQTSLLRLDMMISVLSRVEELII